MNKKFLVLLMMTTVIILVATFPIKLNGQYYTTTNLVSDSRIMVTDVCRLDTSYSNSIIRGDATCGAHEDFDFTFGMFSGGSYDGFQVVLQTKIQILNADSSRVGMGLVLGYQYALSSSSSEWVYIPLSKNIGKTTFHLNTGWSSEYIGGNKESGYILGGRLDHSLMNRVSVYAETLYPSYATQRHQVGSKFTVVEDIFSININYSNYNGIGFGVFLAHRPSSF
jgi:hypothetical protein